MARTAVAKAKTTLPANLSADMQAELEALKARIAAPSGDRIQITQDKLFKLPNGETSDTLTCIIVDFVNANFFYESGYQKGEITPPACFALGVNTAEMAPSVNSPDAQHDKCSGCWANQFGSAGKGKACANTKLLAVLPPDSDAETPLMILKVSATGIKPFDAYVGSVARAHQRPPRGVITEISFDPNVTYASLRFSLMAPCDDNQFMLAHSRKGEAMERLLVEPDVNAMQSAAPAPKGRALKAPARRKAA